MKTNFYIFAFAAQGEGISGSDRIFAELTKNLANKVKIHVYVSDEGRKMCARMNLAGTNIIYHVSNISHWRKLGYFTFYIRLIILGIWKGLTLKLITDYRSPEILYSASEFWMDFIPAFLLRVRNRNAKWVASWYQTAPAPWKGFASRYHKFSLPYWILQKASKPIISVFADIICVNNTDEKKNFPEKSKKGKVFVMYGAVSLGDIRKFLSTNNQMLTTKIYDAVFQGRLHPQKGVVELIDIWKKVVGKRPNAKLAMIGDGPLMRNVKLQISNYKLENNVTLFGFLFDGYEKYKIFSQSKIVVHPSTFDSGGMASAEAMAFGIPCVGFDLKSYESYYPRGMIKVKPGNLDAFADAIINLLDDNMLREKIGVEAADMVNESWSWEKRADEFWSFVTHEENKQ